MAGLPISDNRQLLSSIRSHIPKNRWIQNVGRETHPLLTFFLAYQAPAPFTRAAESISMPVQTAASPATFQTENMFEQVAPQRPGVATLASWRLGRKVHKSALEKEEIMVNEGNPDALFRLADYRDATDSEALCNELDRSFTLGPSTLADYNDRDFRGIMNLVGFSMDTNGAFVANQRGDFVGSRYILPSGEMPALRDGIDATIPQNERWRNWAATTTDTGLNHETVMQVHNAKIKTKFTASAMQILKPSALGAPEKSQKEHQEAGRQSVLFMSDSRYLAYRSSRSLAATTLSTDALLAGELEVAEQGIVRVPLLGQARGNPIIGVDRKSTFLWKMPGAFPFKKDMDGDYLADWTSISITRLIGQVLTIKPNTSFVIHGSW